METTQQVRDECHEELDLTKLSTEAVIAGAVFVCLSLQKFVEKNWIWLIESRQRFQYRQGSRGVQLEVEGTLMFWDEFLDVYLGTTAENFRKITQRLHEMDETDEPSAKAKPLDLEKLVGKVVCYQEGQYKVTAVLGSETDDSFEIVVEAV